MNKEDQIWKQIESIIASTGIHDMPEDSKKEVDRLYASIMQMRAEEQASL